MRITEDIGKETTSLVCSAQTRRMICEGCWVKCGETAGEDEEEARSGIQAESMLGLQVQLTSRGQSDVEQTFPTYD